MPSPEAMEWTDAADRADAADRWVAELAAGPASLRLAGPWQQLRAELLAAVGEVCPPGEVNTWRLLTVRPPACGWTFVAGARATARILRQGCVFGASPAAGAAEPGQA